MKKLTGLELKYFRSIGGEGVNLNPLSKCNILIGTNNSGKSNVLRAVEKISERFQKEGRKTSIEELDLNNRSTANEFRFKLWFEISGDETEEKKLTDLSQTRTFWFELVWSRGSSIKIIDHTFANIGDFYQANSLLGLLTNNTWHNRVDKDIIRREFLKRGDEIFPRFSQCIPQTFFIPVFRQIRDGQEYTFDGQNLVELLARYRSPAIGLDEDRAKFDRIQEFTRHLLHLPNAEIEVSLDNPTIIINNNGLRLPLSSYGTGVHELIILGTAVFSRENSICLLEEPEIHLHPRLQRELLHFLVNETSNLYLMTTHSPTLINSTNAVTQVFHINSKEGMTSGVPIMKGGQAVHVLRDLGLKPSDILQSNCVIWVEGPSDCIYLRRWLELLAPELIEGKDFIFMCFRRSSRMNFDIDQFDMDLVNVLKLNPNVILIKDRDVDGPDDDYSQENHEQVEQCNSMGGYGWVTDGREIENYLSNRTINAAIKEIRDIDISFSLGLFDTFEEELDKELRKHNESSLNYPKCKTNYSRKFAEHITKDDIDDRLHAHLSKVIDLVKDWNN